MNAIDMGRKAPSREATEFHIGPPIDPAYDDDDCLDRIERFMGELFPGLVFHASLRMPFRQVDQFCIVPMLGYAGGPSGDPDEVTMLPAPAEELMGRLYAAIQSFNPTAPPRLIN